MSILATLRRSGGISALARQLGESPPATMAAASVLLPDLLEDFRQFDGGMLGLLEVIDEAGGGALAQTIMNHEPVDVQPGLSILARTSRPGSARGADRSALGAVDARLRARMLPLLAMLVAGYLSARATSGGLDVEELAALLDARDGPDAPGEEQV